MSQENFMGHVINEIKSHTIKKKQKSTKLQKPHQKNNFENMKTISSQLKNQFRWPKLLRVSDMIPKRTKSSDKFNT